MCHLQCQNIFFLCLLHCVLQSVFAIIYILAGEVVSLIDFLSFTTWMFIAFIQLAVVVLRFKMKDAPRSYKVKDKISQHFYDETQMEFIGIFLYSTPYFLKYLF